MGWIHARDDDRANWLPDDDIYRPDEDVVSITYTCPECGHVWRRERKGPGSALVLTGKPCGCELAAQLQKELDAAKARIRRADIAACTSLKLFWEMYELPENTSAAAEAALAALREKARQGVKYGNGPPSFYVARTPSPGKYRIYEIGPYGPKVVCEQDE